MKKFHLNNEQKNMVEENQNLVHYILTTKLSILPTSDEYYDDFQIGVLGLMKAVESYNPTKNNKFATYASTCITNEIFMNFRKNKKHNNQISIYEELSKDKDGNSFFLGETIVDRSVVDFGKRMSNNELINESINIIVNCLPTLGKIALLYKMAGISQYCTAIVLDICQSYISRLIRKNHEKVKKVLKNKNMYKQKFKIQFFDETFQMEFLLEDTALTLTALESFLIDEEKSFKIPFKMTYVNGIVRIYFFAMKESFLYVAELLRKIECKEEIGKKDFYEILCNYEQAKNKNIKKTDSISSQVRDYIFKLDSFTIEEIRNVFPNIPGAKINTIITKEYKIGTIDNICRGKYSVISKKKMIDCNENWHFILQKN